MKNPLAELVGGDEEIDPSLLPALYKLLDKNNKLKGKTSKPPIVGSEDTKLLNELSGPNWRKTPAPKKGQEWRAKPTYVPPEEYAGMPSAYANEPRPSFIPDEPLPSFPSDDLPTFPNDDPFAGKGRDYGEPYQGQASWFKERPRGFADSPSTTPMRLDKRTVDMMGRGIDGTASGDDFMRKYVGEPKGATMSGIILPGDPLMPLTMEEKVPGVLMAEDALADIMAVSPGSEATSPVGELLAKYIQQQASPAATGGASEVPEDFYTSQAPPGFMDQTAPPAPRRGLADTAAPPPPAVAPPQGAPPAPASGGAAAPMGPPAPGGGGVLLPEVPAGAPAAPPAADGLGAGPLGLGAPPPPGAGGEYMPSLESSGTLLPGVGPGEGGGWSDGAGIIEQNGNHAGEAGGKQGPSGILGNLSKALDLSSPSGQAIFTTAMGLMSGEGKNFLDVAGRAGQGGLGVFSQAKSSQELSELRKEQQKANRADEMWRRQVQAADYRLRREELENRQGREASSDDLQWAQFDFEKERAKESDYRYDSEKERQEYRDLVGDNRYWSEWERQSGRDREDDRRWQEDYKHRTGREFVQDMRLAEERRVRRVTERRAKGEERRDVARAGREGEAHTINVRRALKAESDEEQITPHDRNAEKKRLEKLIPLIKDPTQKNDNEILYADIVNKTPMTVGELRKRRAQASARSIQRVVPGMAGGSHEALVGGGGAPPSPIPPHARGTAPAGSQAPNVTGDDLKARREARSAQ